MVYGSNSSEMGSYNPFDSDEEAHQKPRRAASVPTLEKYTNPFDEGDGGKVREKPATKRVQFQKGASRNPFSDDEEEPAPATRSSKDGKIASRLENGTLFDNTRPSGQSYFDEIPNFNQDGEGFRAKKGERFFSQVKERASSAGESALRTAEKLKESSVNQAHKLKIKKPNGSSPENPISSEGKPSSSSRQRDLLFGEEEPRPAISSAARSRYRNGFRDTGGFENQTVQELENYAAYKAEETTETVNNCLKVAENIKEDASKTLVTLHQQGEQITRTHITAANIDYDLRAGEKLLGSLGGIFSKTWKPKRTRPITGPILTRDDSFKRRGNHLEQRAALGLVRSPKGKSRTANYTLAADTPQARIELEKAKQDDALSDLSNVLEQLKDMAVDMGSEIGRQNDALDHLSDDVTELGFRVKGANARGRRLLGK